jgi:protein N-terminal methyltransferase
MSNEGQNNTTANAVPDTYIDHASSMKYWNDVPATVNGMLDGHSWFSRIDLRGSANFLAKIRRLSPASPKGKLKLGVDCGAGIGRVIEGFLINVCEVVDVVEPVEKFTEVLRNSALRKEGVVGDIYTMGIENWIPAKKYDLIWTQWCVVHLTDAQLVEYLVRCRTALTETGIMVLKENNSIDPDGQDVYDDIDSTVTRTDEKFRKIFEEAGMRLIKSEEQVGNPKKVNFLPIKFYALRPKN